VESQKMDLEWASVGKAKCNEFHEKMKRFRGPVGPGDSADSQKLDLEWASVWTATCKAFFIEIKDFGASVAGGQRGIAQNAPRVGLNMESKM